MLLLYSNAVSCSLMTFSCHCLKVTVVGKHLINMIEWHSYTGTSSHNVIIVRYHGLIVILCGKSVYIIMIVLQQPNDTDSYINDSSIIII